MPIGRKPTQPHPQPAAGSPWAAIPSAKAIVCDDASLRGGWGEREAAVYRCVRAPVRGWPHSQRRASIKSVEADGAFGACMGHRGRCGCVWGSRPSHAICMRVETRLPHGLGSPYVECAPSAMLWKQMGEVACERAGSEHGRRQCGQIRGDGTRSRYEGRRRRVTLLQHYLGRRRGSRTMRQYAGNKRGSRRGERLEWEQRR